MREETENVFRKHFSSSLATRPKQGLSGGFCELSDDQKTMATEAVLLYLSVADSIVRYGSMLDWKASNAEAMRRSAVKLKDLAAQLHAMGFAPDDPITDGLLKLRFECEKHAEPLPPQVLREAQRTILQLCDALVPLEPLVNSVLKYVVKLQLLHLRCRSLLDKIEDVQFTREIKDELALME